MKSLIQRTEAQKRSPAFQEGLLCFRTVCSAELVHCFDCETPCSPDTGFPTAGRNKPFLPQIVPSSSKVVQPEPYDSTINLDVSRVDAETLTLVATVRGLSLRPSQRGVVGRTANRCCHLFNCWCCWHGRICFEMQLPRPFELVLVTYFCYLLAGVTKMNRIWSVNMTPIQRILIDTEAHKAQHASSDRQ